MSSTWGIDLGTTNSCIARIDDGRPAAIPIDGSPIVPSIVLFDGERVVVGREARNLELLHPERTVRSIKRRMGREATVRVGDRALSPEEVSAEILRALAEGAFLATGAVVRDVVITVPAYFDDGQRRATLRAGELAGLNVLRLLNEPTSASLVYEQVGTGPTAREPEIVMVYDLGGGTFDVSVLEVFEGVREVRATAGDTALGGDDFDALLYRRLVAEVEAVGGVAVEDDVRATAALRNAAERAKIALSSALEHRVAEEFVATDENKAPVHLDVTLRRRDFEDMIRPLLARTVELARRALDDAKLVGQTLSRVCLVGGSTRIPLVASMLNESFGVPLHHEVDPDLAVALGASVQAGLLAGDPIEKILVDVSAHSLGILAIGEQDDLWEAADTFVTVIHRNTVLPAERSREVYTACDQQEVFRVQVFQGESKRASENRSVGTFDVALEPAPVGTPIAVTFAYDLDGIVRVTVKQEGVDRIESAELRLADGSERPRETVVLKKARRLLETLDPARRDRLASQITAYEAASPSDRASAEEALLDAILDVESDGED